MHKYSRIQAQYFRGSRGFLYRRIYGRVLIELWKPTLPVDEADTILPGNEQLCGILNSGHTRRSAYVLRHTEVRKKTYEPRRFSTWAPMAIALIGSLPGTLADRSIILPRQRKRRDQIVERIPRDNDAGPFSHLRSQCTRWARDNFDQLQRCDPPIPSWLNDRAADNWHPLCAIAAVAGGQWPTRIKDVIRALGDVAPKDEDIGTRLLQDMQRMFQEGGVDRPLSKDLARALHDMEGRPWPEYGRQRKPITTNQIARLLNPYRIYPITIRDASDRGKGYRLKDCQDALNRYIPPFQNVTPCQTSNEANLHETQTVTTAYHVTDKKNAETHAK